MAALKTILNFFLAGALLGALGASYFGPKYIAWDNTTAVGGAQCPCADSSRQGAVRLVYYQLYSGGAGGGLGLAAGIAWAVSRRKKLPPASSAAAPASPAQKP